VGSGTHTRFWRKTVSSNTLQIHTRLAAVNQSIHHIVGSLLVYSSASVVSLLISNVGTGGSVPAVWNQHMELLSRTSAVYTTKCHIIAISGHTGQDIQLSFLLRSTCTQGRSISSTLNGGYSSLTVVVRMASYGLLTFHSITGTSLTAHGSIRRTNDYSYLTLSTIVGVSNTMVYMT
jgi:hypothetical protein